ncbi:heavy metal sensor histidine kinase [Pseudomonas fontis]|uniref:Sensor protein n=1 Tax=Pseudomonas fontis TaxID=2942633 RepID=A0ABT5NP13_9PSED|nr:heavy metal sensor histidine kinase [Pseudomonas fontis]MDD0974373.1 heavy metal sensor histidine kinase [Pseudomonas fontis]MDD0989915.1 heavy metal sensor histidine kinase [Pseudomonas fontis]
MRSTRLSLRLGLSVSLMGAALVVLLAGLAVLALDHELDSRAGKILARKMEQIEHSLAADLKANDLASRAHPLLDLVMGHDDLSLNIVAQTGRHSGLLSLGPALESESLRQVPASSTLRYSEWTDSNGDNLLTAAKLMKLQDGTPVRVLLTVNRADDRGLLQAYLRSTVIALPLLLLLIGFAAWKLVQRGLAPLRRFRRIAGQVSAQDLGHRLPEEDLPQELRELAQAINVMLGRLDGGVQQLSQFSDDLAHELRTPISNLMGKAQVTLSRTRSVEDYRTALEDSIEELTRLNRIITDMLFLAQVDQPTTQIQLKPVALADEVARIAELFSISAEARGIELRVQGWGTVQADRLMVQRALSNLLSNAIRYGAADQPIDVGIELRDNTLQCWVQNRGPGIAAGHLPHLFERFYRAGSGRSRLEGGTGLGLAIVKSIMQVHGGRVEVSNAPEGPTRFSLVFAV